MSRFLERLRTQAGRSPLLLPVLTAVAALLGVDGSRAWLFAAVPAGLFLSGLLQGKRGILAALIFSLTLGGLHFYRTGEQEKWQELLNRESCVTFSGSAMQSSPGTLILEGYALNTHTPPPLSPCRVEVKLPASWKQEKDAPALPPGKHYLVRGQILPETPAANPGEFDHALWSKRLGISARLTPELLEEDGEGSWKSRIMAASSRLNARLCRCLNRGLSPGDPRGEVVKSLVLGAKNEASRETMDIFRYSGLLHVFAVSGLHVGLAALLLSPLLLLLGLRPRPYAVVLSLLLLLYAFATGLSVSAVRAVVMLIVVLAGFAFTRKSTAANRLALAALLILLWDSQALFQLGFLLSFLIFAVVVAAAESFTLFHRYLRPDDYIPPLLYTRREKGNFRLGKCILGSLFISLSAWVAATVILTPSTGYLSPYTPLVNTLLTLPITLLMANGLLCLLLGWIPLLGPLLFSCCHYLAGILLSLASLSLTLPGAVTPLSRAPGPEQVTVFSLYGTGYAAAMGNPALLLNSGTESAARYIIIPGLLAEGYTPQIVVQPHREKEKSGLSLIRSRYAVKHILSPEKPFPRAAGESETEPSLSNGTGGELRLLDDPALFGRFRRKAERTRLFLWTYQNRNILFFDDAGYNAEKRMMVRHPRLHADVLVLGQHASDYSGSPDFIRFLQPKLVIFTETLPFSRNYRTTLLQEKDKNSPEFWNLKTQGAIRLQLSRETVRWEKAR